LGPGNLQRRINNLSNGGGGGVSSEKVRGRYRERAGLHEETKRNAVGKKKKKETTDV